MHAARLMQIALIASTYPGKTILSVRSLGPRGAHGRSLPARLAPELADCSSMAALAAASIWAVGAAAAARCLAIKTAAHIAAQTGTGGE